MYGVLKVVFPVLDFRQFEQVDLSIFSRFATDGFWQKAVCIREEFGYYFQALFCEAASWYGLFCVCNSFVGVLKINIIVLWMCSLRISISRTSHLLILFLMFPEHSVTSMQEL